MSISCRSCSLVFPLKSFPHLCPECGDLFGFQDGLFFSPELIEENLTGFWSYKHSFSLPENAPVVTLGEGNTPLIWSEVLGKEVGFKLESLNPTGSFKDRGAAVLVSWLLSAGISSAVEDSSGNAGASFAAYASSAGIEGRVYVPAYASGPKRVQIESYGAEVVAVPGPRSNAADEVLKELEKGAVYASHAYLPHGTAGMATIAYELVQQMNQVPRTIILPVGHGSLLLGIFMGFEALLKSREISQLPRLVGVQAAACAPLWTAYQKGSPTPVAIEGKKTAAEGVSIIDPYHGKEVLTAVKQSDGFFIKVEEEDILEGREKLAALGIYVEPTSALVWSGLSQTLPQIEAPIICIMTGHGLKSL